MSAKSRDKDATRQKLIQAIGNVLSRKGFSSVGVNAVAREANVDKVLIYRYFDGLPGLMTAYAREGDFWPTVEEMVGPDLENLKKMSYGRQLAVIVRNMLRGVRRRPQTMEILAWEQVERNELTLALEEIRTERHTELSVMFPPPPGKEALMEGLGSILFTSGVYLMLRARFLGSWGRWDLRTEDGWVQMEEMQEAVLIKMFAD